MAKQQTHIGRKTCNEIISELLKVTKYKIMTQVLISALLGFSIMSMCCFQGGK